METELVKMPAGLMSAIKELLSRLPAAAYGNMAMEDAARFLAAVRECEVCKGTGDGERE